jgi:hypothetical protein
MGAGKYFLISSRTNEDREGQKKLKKERKQM